MKISVSFELRNIILGVFSYDNIENYVRNEIRAALERASLLKEEQFSPRVLGFLVKIVVTRGYYMENFGNTFINVLKEYTNITVRNNGEIIIDLEELGKLSKSINKLILTNVIDDASKKHHWSRTLESLKALYRGVKKAGSLKLWVDTLYRLIRSGDRWKSHEYYEGIKGFGRKSAESVLRDVGYFDRVPIDRHERRFQLRTGIALIYAPLNKDPAQPEFYAEALARYCKENLKNIELSGVSLELAPGAVDWAIWVFSCDKKEAKTAGEFVQQVQSVTNALFAIYVCLTCSIKIQNRDY